MPNLGYAILNLYSGEKKNHINLDILPTIHSFHRQSYLSNILEIRSVVNDPGRGKMKILPEKKMKCKKGKNIITIKPNFEKCDLTCRYIS